MEISKYKQAMKYLLNDNAPLKTFVINPDARLVDNDPRPQTESLSLANGGRVGFKFGNLVTSTNKELEKESNAQKRFQLKKRLEFLEQTQKRAKGIAGSKFIENLILKKDSLGRPFFSDYLEKLNALEDLQNNKYLNPKTNKPFTPQEWLGSSASYRSKFRDPETFLENKKEYQKEYMRQRKENDPEFKKKFLEQKKEEYYSKERADKNITKQFEPGKIVLREQRNRLLSYMSEAAKDNPNYKDIIKDGKFVGVTDKENGINYYEAGYKGKLGKNSKLITEHPDFENVNNLTKLADNFKRDLPNKAIASYFSSYERVPTMSEMYSFLQADPKFIDKMSPAYFKKNPLELHHQISMTDSPSQKIQLLLRDRNNQAGLKMIEYQKGNITKQELDKELKKLNTRYFINGEPLGAIETSPETQLRTAKSQTTKLFNQRLKENPELIKQMAEKFDIKSLELLNKLGCGNKYADGGRIKFGEGSNCYIKGLEKLQSDEPLAAKDINVVKDFLKEEGVSNPEIKNLTSLAKQSGKSLLQGFEDVVGFGRGVAGRTLLPLAALNSALEQWTSGNYGEGFRKIGNLLDITTLVGDPLGFEKMRTEGTIEDVRKKIGDKNQDSLNRLLEFKDHYYNLKDVNKKLQRAQSAMEGQYDSESSNVDTNYLNELKTKQKDLNKIINSSKYQNIRNDYLNVGNAIKNEIFERNKNRPEQEEYSFETATQEYLKTILGDDFYNDLPDENKQIFKKLSAIKEPIYNETPIQAPEYSEGGRVGFADGSGPKMGRRGFLGLLTGAAALSPEIKKMLTTTGQTAKVASKLKFEKAEGMYSWFPDLVEKIKVQGKP